MSRVLLLACLVLCAAPSPGAFALDEQKRGDDQLDDIELDVHLLEVGDDAMRTLDPKPALDAVVRRRSKGEETIEVSRHRSLGLRLGLIHQRPGVRVVEAPRVHAIEGMPRAVTATPWLGAEEAAPFAVVSRRTRDGRIALTITLEPQHSVVHIVVNDGESVMVSGLQAPPTAWPSEAPRLGDEAPQRTRLLFVTPHR